MMCMDYTVLTKVHAVRLYLYASSASGCTREDTVGCTREDTVGCTRVDEAERISALGLDGDSSF